MLGITVADWPAFSFPVFDIEPSPLASRGGAGERIRRLAFRPGKRN